MKNGIKIVYNILFYGFLSILIAFLLLGFIAKKSDSGVSIGGYRVYDILTGSMSPTIKPGSLVVVKETSPNNIKENDVITFRSDITNNVTTHRAIKVIKSNGDVQFITKGDANNTEDPIPLKGDLLVGKVMFQVPYLGGILRSIQNNKVIFIGSLILIIILVGFISNRYTKVKKLV